MRIPLTKFGWPQVVVLPLVFLAAAILYPLAARAYFPDWARFGPWALFTFWGVEFVLVVGLVWTLCFFRDPVRCCPDDGNILVAPADGKITNIELLQHEDTIGGKALRIGIFLSIFDVHINRAPCDATVEKIVYRKGKYNNAMKPQSGQVNESNDLAFLRTEEPRDRLVVRQISGAVARRIVCAAREGQRLAGGEKFGMIKFGSRTELLVPARQDIECLVKVGDKVKAGITPVIRYNR